MGKSRDRVTGSLDIVQTHKIHSIAAFSALERILEALVEVDPEERRDTISRVLDYVHKLNRDYRNLALRFTSEEEFPDRADRWPDFFQKKPSSRKKRKK